MGEQILYREDSDGIYDVYTIESSYRRSTGLLAMARGSTNGNAAPVIVRTDGGIVYRVVTFSVVRSGDDKPKIPDSRSPELSGGEILIKEVVSPFVPTPTGDGTIRSWRVDGEYTYIVKNPSRLSGSDLATGTTPLDIASADQQNFPGANFDGVILGSSDPLRNG